MTHFIYLFLRWCPGILGILLRQKLYPKLLRACGRNTLIGRFVDLRNPQAIILGNSVILNDYAVLDASRYNGEGIAISIGDKVFIGASTRLSAGPGTVHIEEKSNIGSGCSLNAGSTTLHLGHHVLLAGFCTVGEASGERNPVPGDISAATGSGIDNRTRLGSGCWLGLRSQVGSGVAIGEGTIVGAHSLVAETLPAYVIAYGQPARVIRDRP